MAKLISFSNRSKQVRVAVCGLSGNIDRSVVGGVGKSWLCSRLVHTAQDVFVEAVLGDSGEDLHSSTLSHEDFFTREVANDHFLYYGRRTVAVPTDGVKDVEVEVHVVEQTELLDGDHGQVPFQPSGPLAKPYNQRAVKRNLIPCCAPKHVYINRQQVYRCARNMKFDFAGRPHLERIFPQPFKVDVYLLVYDGSLSQRAAIGTAQKARLAELLLEMENKGRTDRCIAVITKCDELPLSVIQSATQDIQSTCERVRLTKPIPAIPVSARENVNMDFLQQTIVLRAWGKIEMTRIRPYDEAVRVQEGSLGSDLKKLEAALLEDYDGDQLPSWASFHHKYCKTPWLKHLVSYRGVEGVRASFEEKIRPWRSNAAGSVQTIPAITMANDKDWTLVPQNCFPFSCTEAREAADSASEPQAQRRFHRSPNRRPPRSRLNSADGPKTKPNNQLAVTPGSPPQISSPEADGETCLTTASAPIPPVTRSTQKPSPVPIPAQRGRPIKAKPRLSVTNPPSNPQATLKDTAGIPEADVAGTDVFYEDIEPTSPPHAVLRAPEIPKRTSSADATQLDQLPQEGARKAPPPKPPRRNRQAAASESATRSLPNDGVSNVVTVQEHSRHSSLPLSNRTDGRLYSRPGLSQSQNDGWFRMAVDETDHPNRAPIAVQNGPNETSADKNLSNPIYMEGAGGGAREMSRNTRTREYFARMKIAGVTESYDAVATVDLPDIPTVQSDGTPLLLPRPAVANEMPYSCTLVRAAAAAATATATAPIKPGNSRTLTSAQQNPVMPSVLEDPQYCDSGGNARDKNARTQPRAQTKLLAPHHHDPQFLLSDIQLNKLHVMRGLSSQISHKSYLSEMSTLSIDVQTKADRSLSDLLCEMNTSTDTAGYVKTAGFVTAAPDSGSASDSDTDSLDYISP
eukprot:scpid34662/ scgid30297/ Rho GTPase-activating protein 35; Glucocorticoid receptor DNA-binding factor 1; Glucocorticoid receptor repression factor 1; Rho GAP p190A